MKYYQPTRLGPDVSMNDEVYASPYILVDPTEYKNQQPGVPELARSGARFRNIPAEGGSNYLVASEPGRSLSGDLTTLISNPWVFLVLLGVAGLLGYYLGKPSKGVHRNPPRRRQRKNRKLQRYANRRRRDAAGRFA